MKKMRIPKSVAKKFKQLKAMKGKLVDQLHKTERQAKQVDVKLRGYTKKYPERALLAAAVGGAALGAGAVALWRRRKRKRR